MRCEPHGPWREGWLATRPTLIKGRQPVAPRLSPEPLNPSAFMVHQDKRIMARRFPEFVGQASNLVNRSGISVEQDEPERADLAEEAPFIGKKTLAGTAKYASGSPHQRLTVGMQVWSLALSSSQNHSAISRAPKPVTLNLVIGSPPFRASSTYQSIPATNSGYRPLKRDQLTSADSLLGKSPNWAMSVPSATAEASIFLDSVPLVGANERQIALASLIRAGSGVTELRLRNSGWFNSRELSRLALGDRSESPSSAEGGA